MPGSLNAVFVNWAALISLCALPYLKLRQHFGLESTEALQWSLVAISVFGTVGVLCAAWRRSRERAWRASHGLLTSLPSK
ncbi:MAG: hypothetical protein ACTHLO_08680 [Pseudolabrys sp.]